MRSIVVILVIIIIGAALVGRFRKKDD